MDTQIMIRDGGPYGSGLSLPPPSPGCVTAGWSPSLPPAPARQTATRTASRGTGSTLGHARR
jgi:hypothetical protein